MAKAYSLWIFDRECNPIYHQDWSRIHYPISNSSSTATATTTSTSTASTAASSFFQSNRSSNTTTTTSPNHRRPGETLLPNVSRSVPSLQEVSSSQNATSQDDGLLPLDEEAKLVYGVVFSLRNMVRKLGGGHDHFNSYSTSTYTLSHLLTPTFHTFILFTDPISPPSRLPNSSSSSINGGGGGIPGTAGMSLKGVLLQIWRGPWIENVIKNPLIRGLEREEFEEDEDEFESDGEEDEEEDEDEASEQKQKDKSEIRIERRKEERNSGIDSDALRIGIERVLNQNKLSAPSTPIA